MLEERSLALATLLLSLVAGFCDTTTFVAADRIFSAHVTGNFVVLACNLIFHPDTQVWMKLLTLPIFIIAVLTGGLISRRIKRVYDLVLAEGVLLLTAGLLSCFHHAQGAAGVNRLIVVIAVFAMGLQNAFGRLHEEEVYGQTTMMTTNVNRIALDFGIMLTSRFGDAAAFQNLKGLLLTLTGFFGGCLAGGIIARQQGLDGLIIPAVLLIGFGIWKNRNLS